MVVHAKTYLRKIHKCISIIIVGILVLSISVLSSAPSDANNTPIVLSLKFSELKPVNGSFIVLEREKIILSSMVLESPEHVYSKIIKDKVRMAIAPLGINIIDINNLGERISEYGTIETGIRNKIQGIIGNGIDIDFHLYAANDRYVTVFTIYEKHYNDILASKLKSIAIEEASINGIKPLVIFIIRDFTVVCRFLSYNELSKLNDIIAENYGGLKVADAGCSILGQFVYLEGTDKDLTSYMSSPEGLTKFYNKYSELIIKIADFIRNATEYFETPIIIELFNFSLIKPYIAAEPISSTETPSTSNVKANEGSGQEGGEGKATTVNDKLDKELPLTEKGVETAYSNTSEKSIGNHNVYITVLIILAVASIITYVAINKRYK